MSRYAELHAHTNYSFLDGASHPFDLVARAAELGYAALAVTDHDGFRGAAKVHVAAREVGLPIVYGTEVGMGRELPAASYQIPAPTPSASLGSAPPSGAEERSDDAGGRPRKRMHGSKPVGLPPSDHLVLLAPDPAGYAALSRFVTRGQFRGEKDRPVYAYDELAIASREGRLVALTGCRSGAVPRAAQAGDLPGAMTAAATLREIFPGQLFIELTHHGMPDDDARNDLLLEVARRLQIPYVATNNAHYAHRRDADLAEVLAAIAGRRDLDTADGFRPATDLRHLRSPEEMSALFRRYPGAVERSADLAASLAFDLDLLAPDLPDFPMPSQPKTST